jgi:L-ascorbate metabolism protein UlaG (beta-lactamase superfamily)
MEITYIGHSSFKLKGKDISLVIDPYDPKVGYKFPKQECDVLLTTHNHFDHHYIDGVSGYRLLIEGPGEYELSDVFINGLQVFHDDKEGAERGRGTIYLIEMDNFTLLHLGDLGHELSKETLEKLPDIDVLFIPVGGKYTINAAVAAKVISSLEPSIVIPMHYKTDDLTGVEGLDTVDKFLEEMGATAKKEEKLKISNRSDIPEETTIVVLNQKH